jgi:hypothetical protein
VLVVKLFTITFSHKMLLASGLVPSYVFKSP